jgi:uroporphyrinogen-III synthase
MPKIVVTRPLVQALPFAERLRDAGHDAVVFPLLEILPLPDRAPLRKALHDLSSYALVVFISPNAIDAAFRELNPWPSRVPLAVMGEGSRQALAQHGLTDANATIFSPRDPLRTDSQTLLEALDLDALRGKRVMIIRGESGRELLGDALSAEGVDVVQVAAYRRAAPELNEARRAQLRELTATDNDWIVTSSEALRILMDMLRQLDGGDPVAKMQRQRLVVPHARIAETASALGLRNVMLTGSGDEQLLAALQSNA